MAFLHKLFASLHRRAETAAAYDENLRAEDGFVPASQGGSRFLRIY
jgi:hypothetical protein